MHHKVVGNFGSEADIRSLYYSRFRFNETSDVRTYTHGGPAKQILTESRPRYFENEPDFRPMHTKLERLLSKSLTTLEVMTYYSVVHTGPGLFMVTLNTAFLLDVRPEPVVVHPDRRSSSSSEVPRPDSLQCKSRGQVISDGDRKILGHGMNSCLRCWTASLA